MNVVRFIGRLLARIFAVAIMFAAILALAVKIRYGGGHTNFPDRTGEPRLPESALEIVAELPTPPGNIAVAPDGRVFVTLHPEAHPDLKVVELAGGQMKPFPSLAFQDQREEPKAFDNVLSIRIDRQNRLWALDNGTHGLHPARLLAFDLGSGALVHEFVFPREIAGLGSHLNDFQVSNDGAHIFIADASFFAKKPALIVYDVDSHRARRLLQRHKSVTPDFFTPVVQGRKMELFGLLSIRPGVDSIALSRNGEWLLFAPVTSRKIYGMPVAALLDDKLGDVDLGKRVIAAADKTMSDGITTDDANNIYLTDLEHSAIVVLKSGQPLETLVRSERLLRWPDGLSFGPGGWLYVSCSSLHEVLGQTPSHIRDHAPYHVLRVKTGTTAQPGQ